MVTALELGTIKNQQEETVMGIRYSGQEDLDQLVVSIMRHSYQYTLIRMREKS